MEKFKMLSRFIILCLFFGLSLSSASNRVCKQSKSELRTKLPANGKTTFKGSRSSGVYQKCQELRRKLCLPKLPLIIANCHPANFTDGGITYYVRVCEPDQEVYILKNVKLQTNQEAKGSNNKYKRF